jgi:hypothetical protein
VFVPSVVLLIVGGGLVVAAVLNVVFEPTAASAGLSVAAATVGGAAIVTAWHLHGGDRRAWIAAMVLLPIVGAVAVFDAYVFGQDRFPFTPGLIVPGVAWVCLYLPATRAFVAHRQGRRDAPAG